MQVGQTEVTRRAVVRAAAWSVPVLALAVATPAASASTLGTLQVELLTTGLAGGGYEFYLNESKTTDSTTNVLGSNQTVIVPAFRVVDSGGAPVSNVTWSVTGDDLQDGQGHYVLGFFDTGYAGPFTEGTNSTKRTASGVSPTGRFAVKVNTITWSQEACTGRGNFVPPGGTFTVVASAPGYSPVSRTFTALVHLQRNRVISCP